MTVFDEEKAKADRANLQGKGEVKCERNATFLSCCVTLGMTAMGLGVLGLPKAFAKMGYVMSPIIAVAFAGFTDLSFAFLARVCGRIDRYSYDGLSKHYIGYWGVRYTNWAFILQLFCVTVAFISIPMRTLERLIYVSDVGAESPVCLNSTGNYTKLLCAADIACPSDMTCYVDGNPFDAIPCPTTGAKLCFCAEHVRVHRYLIGAAVAAFVAIVGIVKTLHRVAPISWTAFLCLSTAVVLYFVEFGTYACANGLSSPPPLPVNEEDALYGLGNLILAYSCQFQVIACQKEMKEPGRIYTLVHVAVYGMCLPTYLLIGMTGMFLDVELEDNIFDSLGDSVVATIGKWLVCGMVISKTPLAFNAMRDYFFDEIRIFPFCENLSIHTLHHRLLVSFTLALSAYFTSWKLPLHTTLGVSGALLMAPTSFIFPALYIMKDATLYGVQKGGTVKGGFAWNTMFSPQSKVLYVLALVLIAIGVFSCVAGMLGVIIPLLWKKKASDAPPLCSANTA